MQRSARRVGVHGGTATGDPGNGRNRSGGDVTFANVAPGFTRVEQVAGQGSRPIAAWCDYFSSVTGSARDTAPHTSQPLFAYMTDGYTLECYWFVVPYVEPVTVTVLERVCPADYGIAGASREDLLFNCTASATGVEFQVRDDSSPSDYDVTQVTDASGSAAFADVPVKPVVISELSPGYVAARVYCGQAAAGSAIFQPRTPSWKSAGMRFGTTPSPAVGCSATGLPSKRRRRPSRFTNMPAPRGTSQTGSPTKTCWRNARPAERRHLYPWRSGGRAQQGHRDRGCRDMGWRGPGSGIHQRNTGGRVFVRGRLLHGLSGGRCAGTFEPVPVEQFSFQRDIAIAGGDVLECAWFNLATVDHPDQPSPTPTATPTATPTKAPAPVTGIPGTPIATPAPDAPASLVLTTNICPADYDPHDPEAELDDDCVAVTEAIAFSLTALDQDAPLSAAEATTGADGVALFAGLDAGAWLLTETVPEQTRTVFVSSCVSDQRDVYAGGLFTPLTYLGPDGQIGVALVPGETLTCEVYGILEDDETT